MEEDFEPGKGSVSVLGLGSMRKRVRHMSRVI